MSCILNVHPTCVCMYDATTDAHYKYEITSFFTPLKMNMMFFLSHIECAFDVCRWMQRREAHYIYETFMIICETIFFLSENEWSYLILNVHLTCVKWKQPAEMHITNMRHS